MALKRHKDLGLEKMATFFAQKMKPDFSSYFASESLEECAEYLDIDVGKIKEILGQ